MPQSHADTNTRHSCFSHWLRFPTSRVIRICSSPFRRIMVCKHKNKSYTVNYLDDAGFTGHTGDIFNTYSNWDSWFLGKENPHRICKSLRCPAASPSAMLDQEEQQTSKNARFSVRVHRQDAPSELLEEPTRHLTSQNATLHRTCELTAGLDCSRGDLTS